MIKLRLLFAVTCVFMAQSGAAVGSYLHLYEGQTLTVRTTAYNHHEADHVAFHDLSARGTKLRGDSNALKSAAADWSRFPLGTRFEILSTGETYEVDDYGIALAGTQTLDLYMPTLEKMNEWGARQEKVRILQVGSFALSLIYLERAKKHDFIKRMLADVEKHIKVRRSYVSRSTEPARPRGMPPPVDSRAVLSRKPAGVDSRSINGRKPK